MNNNNRSRNFDATYTSQDGKKHNCRVKLLNPKRLLALGLSVTIVATIGGLIIDKFKGTEKTDFPDKPKTEQSGQYNPKNTFEEDQSVKYGYPSDIELIANFLEQNPHLLETVEKNLYKIQAGESISRIAQNNGITVNRLLELNNLGRTELVYEGQEILVETVKDLSELDKEIRMLESYFTDYVFNSNAMNIARGNAATSKEQQMLFYSVIYGNPKTAIDLDSESIQGRYAKITGNFHYESTEKTDEQKEAYIENLALIANDLNEKLNLGGMAEFIVPYDLYRTFCINGHTNSMEIENNYTTIYD